MHEVGSKRIHSGRTVGGGWCHRSPVGAVGPSDRQRAASSAHGTRCLAAPHAANAQVAYATEHGGQFVEVGLSHGAIADQDIAWINTLEPYTDSGLLLRSPLDWSPHWLEQDADSGLPIEGTDDRYRQTSYGMNNYLSRNYSPATALGERLQIDFPGFDHPPTRCSS